MNQNILYDLFSDKKNFNIFRCINNGIGISFNGNVAYYKEIINIKIDNKIQLV